MPDFLLEIGTEEIPAGMIRGLCEELAQRVEEGLKAAGLSHSPVRAGGAPRRLTLRAGDLPERQPDRTEVVAGPPLATARDASGAWTKAALGFARKQGVEVGELREVPGAKGPCAGFERLVQGRAAAEILAEVVPAATDALYLPKAMRWGDGSQLFVRPVRWIVALLGSEVVPMAVKGIASGRTSRGHRIFGAQSVDIASPQAYDRVLEREYVVADPEERAIRIRALLIRNAASAGGVLKEDPELLETVCYLCECPTVVLGDIPREFLSLPSEILITCLREHQKFFVVLGPDGKPLPHFLSVVDAPGDPEGYIRRGNENVSLSRLADARFFYEHDVSVRLEQRKEELKGILFHPKIGTYYDKSHRMEDYARRLAQRWKGDALFAVWAAGHAKADLASLLVQEKEFTELQGIAGGLTALAQGHDEEVAWALYDHYLPLSQDGDLPRNALGCVVALSDKLDTLVEMFRIGHVPSGSKDPFALRRAAMGALRILIERELPLDMLSFLSEKSPPPEGLLQFLEGRLRYLWESRGIAYDEANAVLSFGLTDPLELDRKVSALHTIRNEHREDFDHLSVAFKRAKNILKGLPPYELDPARFLPESAKEGAGERALFSAYEAVKDEAGGLLDAGDYAQALRVLSTVRPAVDRFFDDVLVMCDPEGKDSGRTALQQNRLALLRRLVGLFDRVADFSEIVPRQE
jgi:glycyl-tRNA synthetase beta chain